jgi:DNA-binding GntR family transcriptional regulator
MDRMGLVSQVEAELEKMLSRCFGVSRGTVREALLRLSTRGLVVQHPGRRTRAVPLDEAVTLEKMRERVGGCRWNSTC